MGAALGEWPTQAQASNTECAAANGGGKGGEECWDWEVARVAEGFKGDKGHWSHELKGKLVEQRKVNLAARGRRHKGGKGKEEL
jgi:hypothetical protein